MLPWSMERRRSSGVRSRISCATTWITPDALCSGPVTLTRRAPSTTGRNASKVRAHTMQLAMPVSSSSVMKITPFAVPGR